MKKHGPMARLQLLQAPVVWKKLEAIQKINADSHVANES
jgi:hypothetical protein